MGRYRIWLGASPVPLGDVVAGSEEDAKRAAELRWGKRDDGQEYEVSHVRGRGVSLVEPKPKK